MKCELNKFIEKINSVRNWLDCSSTTLWLTLLLFSVLAVPCLIEGHQPIKLGEMLPDHDPINGFWGFYSGILLIIAWLPEYFIERSFVDRIGSIIRYFVTVWFLWAVLNYVLAVYIYGAIAWTLTIW